MQAYTEIDELETLTASLPMLMDNDWSARSCYAGTAFPTTELLVGMLCYRSDQFKLYELKDLTPTWTLIFDLVRVPVFTDSPTLTGVITIQDSGTTLRQMNGDTLEARAEESVIVESRTGSVLANNALWDGTNWNRFNTAAAAAMLSVEGGAFVLKTAAAGANPISWTTQTIWNATNDGTGSGLDADTLEGSHVASFATSGHDHDSTYAKPASPAFTGNPTVPAAADKVALRQLRRKNQATRVAYTASHKTANFTVEWIGEFESTPPAGSLFAGIGNRWWLTYNYAALAAGQSNKLAFACWNGSAWICAVADSTGITAYQKYRISATFDGTTVKLFIDGVQQATTGSWSGSFPADTTYGLDIGGIVGTPEIYSCDHIIGEFRYWNVARTQPQISGAMAEDALTGSETGLVSLYLFNTGSGTTATDSKSGLNGTITNPLWVKRGPNDGQIASTAFARDVAESFDAGKVADSGDTMTGDLNLASAGMKTAGNTTTTGYQITSGTDLVSVFKKIDANDITTYAAVAGSDGIMGYGMYLDKPASNQARLVRRASWYG